MKEGRGTWRLGLHIFTMLALVIAFCLPVYAGVQEGDSEYEIYPTPQSIEYKNGTMALTDQLTVQIGDGIDSYTRTRIDDTLKVLDLKKAETGSGNTKLTVGVYGSGDAADQYGEAHGADEAVFGRYDAYSLWANNGEIVILGKNTDAAYYGVTTLKRIFEQLDGKSIRNLEIHDYAEVQFRGFIEGYYGNPWSHEDRVDLMKYGSEIKLNQYVYAPKDDPLHNKQWRTLYDEEGLENIAALAQAGNESKCFFVYALHTFMNNPVNLSDATYESEVAIVKAKFEQVIREAGVRQIAILEDDAYGETAQHMIRFLNDMHEWLVELKKEIPDLKTDILYCPTCYMSTTDSKMTQISQGVSKEIHIVVTGGKIWGEVSESFANAFYNGLGGDSSDTARYPYMWVNWPCNDNTKNSQIMGGHNYILHTGINGNHYEGIILNPIQESESSKVGIFTAADYCWNIWQDAAEGDQAWEDSFKYIDHMTAIETKESGALREVAKHQIAQATTQTVGKQVPFEESVDLKPLLEDFTAKMNAGTLTKSDTDGLKAEFEKISNAADYYLEHGTNRRMAAQMIPFFSCLRDMTQADAYLMDALQCIIDGDKSGIWTQYAAAQAMYSRSKTYGFAYYNAGTLYAQAGRKYIEPFTDAVMKVVSDEVRTIVNPEYQESEYKGNVTSSYTSIYQGSMANLTDGSDSTFIWFGQTAAAGDYVQVDLGKAKKIGVVRVVVGAGDTNKWNSYHLEYSLDGQDWEETLSYTGDSSGTDIYVEDFQGEQARYIRIVNDAARGNWVKFSEFSVYAPVEGMVYTNASKEGWEEEQEGSRFSLLSRQDVSLKPGEYVGLKLDRIHEINQVAVSGAGTEKLSLEISMNAKAWTKGGKGNARYIRLYNHTGAAVTFDLTSFDVLTNEILPMDLLDTTIGGQNSSEDARYLGTTRNWMDGDLSSKAKYCSTPSDGSYVTYDLGQEIELRSLRMYVLDTAIDYPRDAVLQASVDNENWTDILEVGDGIADTVDDKDTKPVENPGGGWTHDTVDVAYAYAENADIGGLKARYIRLYFTAGYAHRWVELNEIRINGGEFIPQILDPTFETNAALQRGFEPQNLNDGDLTTAFVPNGTKDGSLVYYLSNEGDVSQINILQSGNSISNAKVSVRTADGVWANLGTLRDSYCSFYTKDLGVFDAVKLEWNDTVPSVYEIITLREASEELEKPVLEAEKNVNAAALELMQAEADLSAVRQKVQQAAAKVNAAVGEANKLAAEVELQQVYAQQSAAEAVVAAKKALHAERKAAFVKAKGNDEEASLLVVEAEKHQADAAKKEAEKNAFLQAAANKQEQLRQLLANQGGQEEKPKVKNFNTKTLKYKVVSASAKTVEVTGPVKKSLSSAAIPATVKYKGVTYKVVQISSNAFKNCKKLQKVTVGSNVKKIGKNAFSGCAKLKTVNLKKASKITSFGKKAFSKIHAKAKVTVPAKKLKAYKNALAKAGLPKKASVKK